MKHLKKYLSKINNGPISEEDSFEISCLLAKCWDQIDGSEQGNTNSGKVGRGEKFVWEAPFLSFEIERHGSMKNKGKYAEIHDWTVDVENATASLVSERRRLVRAKAAPISWSDRNSWKGSHWASRRVRRKIPEPHAGSTGRRARKRRGARFSRKNRLKKRAMNSGV